MADGGEVGGSISGAWTHAHEDDSDGRLVFRPSDFAFPPARGRDSFELLADGGLRHGAPGPDDRRAWGDGSWALDGGRLTLRPDGQPEQRYHVERADGQELVLRPLG
ncbi:MAG: hypothetical protein M3256_21240 [Actinomycetota bacterium]|nr:hypothetical protein [Actinomycetota bacterium]